MDRRFLRYYEDELQHLRDVGGEFAKTHSGIAGKLGLDAFACADPYVERLLEGFAFLAARVQLKLDAEFPRFTDHLLDLLYPDYLAPTPSMALVRLQPDLRAGVLVDGFVVPRGTHLHSGLGPRTQSRCTFSTAHDVTLWPIELAEVRYLTGAALGVSNVPRRAEIEAALQISLKTAGELAFEALSLDRVVLHVRGASRLAYRLHEELLTHAVGVVCQPKRPDLGWKHVVGRTAVRAHGFDDAQALLPCAREAFIGYRLLREYFTLPERFLFVEIDGLGPGIRRCPHTEIDLFVLLKHAEAELEARVGADNLALFVTPAINLFERTCEPVQLDLRKREHRVIVERPLDHEIHTVMEVTGDPGMNGAPQVFQPFYSADYRTDLASEQAFWTMERRPRRIGSSEVRRGGPRSSYTGNDVFLALVDGNQAPWRGDLKRLRVRALCTNRDLPLFMPLQIGMSHFSAETGAPVAAIECLGEPTPPKPSLAHGEPARARPGQPFGETPWRLISHLALNYLSLVDGGQGEGAAALRQMLRLYADLAEPAAARQVDGVRAVASRAIIERMPGAGPIAFGRGLEITLTLEEALFDTGSAFLLGAVLEQFFRKYVSINSFTQTVVTSVERGEIIRWPVRIGQRHVL
jgi:type VI secretion system protein ImpG